MQPMCGQLPPNHPRSTIATEAPSWRALLAAASPPGPAPMITKSKGSTVSVSLGMDGGRQPALAAGLVQQDRGADRDVEAVRDAEHGQTDGLDLRRLPGLGEPVRFGSKNESHGTAQIAFGVQRLGLDPCGDDADTVL